jgi:hypothetical protein
MGWLAERFRERQGTCGHEQASLPFFLAPESNQTWTAVDNYRKNKMCFGIDVIPAIQSELSFFFCWNPLCLLMAIIPSSSQAPEV